MTTTVGQMTRDFDAAKCTTTDAATATLCAAMAVAIPSGKSVFVTSRVTATGPTGDAAYAACTFIAKNVSGTVTVVAASILFLVGGTTALLGDTSLLTGKLSHVVTSNKVQQNVNGVIATAITWGGTLEYEYLT